MDAAESRLKEVMADLEVSHLCDVFALFSWPKAEYYDTSKRCRFQYAQGGVIPRETTGVNTCKAGSGLRSAMALGILSPPPLFVSY